MHNIPFSNELLTEIIEKYQTPLQLYDEKAIKQNAIDFLDKFSILPNFKQYFAVKALPNPHILKLLTNLGMGLDCSSICELKLAELIGCKKNIMFTSNYTSIEDLKIALDMNVIINLDDISLIKPLYNINNKMPEILFFRINPGIGKTDSETKSNILAGPDAKFGLDENNIIKAYTKAFKLGVKEFGIHVMTGSNVLNIEYWKELVDKIFLIINQLKENNIVINYVNLGGGIGINYYTGEQINIELLANNINNKIIENCIKYNLTIPSIAMENGRFITGPYGYLIAKCNVVKKLYGKTYYGLDACMSNLMRPGMYGSYHHISILNKNENKEIANVVGTLCENNDWFAKDRLLPKAEIGDYFVIHDTGAHSHSMGFQYNGKLRAPEILINNDGEYKIIRRRETFNDYISSVTDL
jgi:diaminopimelate decarboxylase